MSLPDAMLTGVYVSDEIRTERAAKCKTCKWYRRFGPLGPRCGLCGCGVGTSTPALVNLTAYEERLPLWGCKHPERAKGQGWRR